MLRLLDPDRDGLALHAVFGDEDCCTYLSDPATKSVAETISLLKKWQIGTEHTTWVVVDAQDGPALGRVTLIPREREIWELGIMLAPAAQGRGLGSKVMIALIEDAFDNRGARRVFADVDEDNTPSLNLFLRLGFQREGLLRGNWQTHIGLRHSVILGLLRDDPRPWRPRIST
jgi:RimJ/RimL family protein N-acetyltransferase